MGDHRGGAMAGRPRIGELLVRAGVIDQAQLESALGEQKQWGKPLGMTLVEMGHVDEETLIRTLARQLRLPVAWLRGKQVRPELLDLVPADLAEKYRCLPLVVNREPTGDVLYLAMEDPADLGAVDDIEFRAGIKVRAVLVAPTELDEALGRLYGARETPQPIDLDPGASGGNPDLVFLDPTGTGGTNQLVGDRRTRPRTELPPLDIARGEGNPSPEVMLRAVTQLLVDKGIFTREELTQRLHTLDTDGDTGAI